MNGSYDFSLLYGDQQYAERPLSYTFNVIGSDKITLNTKRIEVTNWLNEGIKKPLYDDAFPGYYFVAECIKIDFVEKKRHAEMTVTFEAYPFMIREIQEGADIWDKFNFELDYAIETKFNVNGSLNIDLYNSGIINKTPEVFCSSKFEIIKNGITYNFMPGTYKDYRFILAKGNNQMTIKGTGNIEFKFNKEVI